MNKIIKLSLFGLVAFSLLNVNQVSNVKAENNYYQLGTRLEAEDYNNNSLPVITNNKNASGGKAVDAGEYGSVNYTFKMEKSGTYRLSLGYYSGGPTPKISINVNNEDLLVYDIDVLNGWCQNEANKQPTNRLPIAKSLEVELVEGVNTIIYSSAGAYVNLDYIAIYEVDAPYSEHEMYAHLNADGSRIQAEWCRDVVGNYSDKNVRMCDAGTCSDGLSLSVDDDAPSSPGWIVNAPSDGEYTMQFAYYGSNNAQATYNWFINGAKHEFVFPACPAGWNRDAYSSKVSFKVNLNKGENIIYYNYAGKGFIDYDWFRLYQSNVELDKKIEAEDYMNGDVNAKKSSKDYSFLSSYAVEMAQGNVSFDINVSEEGTYSLFLAAYTGTVGAYYNVNVNGENTKCVVSHKQVSGWINDEDESKRCSEENFIETDINLKQGKNTITISKGGDEIGLNYIDLDYIVVTKGFIDDSDLSLKANEIKSLAEIVTLNPEKLTITSNNEKVVKIENDSLIAASGGNAEITIKYINGDVNFETIIKVNVSKHDYNGDDLEAIDTVKTYTGEKCFVDVVMPEGWSFTQTGDSIQVGEYEVTVTFIHPSYNDVVKTAKLTIVKGAYAGNDLIAEDTTFIYDGEEKFIVASAPYGWTIEYDNNGQIEVGEYDVKVTFKHNNFDTVTKNVTLTIIEPVEEFNALPMILGGGVVIVGVGTCLFIFLRKRKSSI